MTPSELERIVEKGTPPSLLLLYGEESFLLERTLKRLIQKVIPADARDFNLSILHGKEIVAERLLDSVRTYPVFCSHRLIVVKETQQIAAGELEQLVPYLKNPVNETILVFVAEKIDARRKFFADFKKYGELVEFKKIYENQMPAVVKDLARQEGLSLAEDALALFCRRVSPSLQDIHTEVQKLAAYVGGRKIAEVADIDAIVTGTRQETVFALTDAIGERNSERAIHLIRRLLDDGTAELLVLSMVTRHLRQLWKVREFVAQRRSSSEIAKGAGINPYFIDGLIRQSANYTVAEFREGFRLVLATDLAMKSAGAHAGLLLERLALALCVTPGRR